MSGGRATGFLEHIHAHPGQKQPQLIPECPVSLQQTPALVKFGGRERLEFTDEHWAVHEPFTTGALP